MPENKLQISRKFYRINQQKLIEYHLNRKLHQQQSISSQTIFNKRVQIPKNLSSTTTSQTSLTTTESTHEENFPGDLYPELPFETSFKENHAYQFSGYKPKSRVHIPSIYRYMFGDEE